MIEVGGILDLDFEIRKREGVLGIRRRKGRDCDRYRYTEGTND